MCGVVFLVGFLLGAFVAFECVAPYLGRRHEGETVESEDGVKLERW